MNVAAIIAHAEKNRCLGKEQITALLAEPSCNREVFAAADRVRRRWVGDEVHLRGLIEFSNTCRQNCHYCGLRRDNKTVDRYRLEPEAVVGLARKAGGYGYRTVVLQSGEDPYYTSDIMGSIIREIKKLGVAVTLSVGEKSRAEYEEYREAGADRYLLRIETTDRRLYEELDPGMSFDNRLRCLRDLKELGYEVGTGCLVGLPGQTLASLADDILFFQTIDADMIGVGPFIPHPATPLKDAAGGTLALALKVMAITRLLMPDVNIPATTAMETLDENGRVIALQSGANVVMPNVTEVDYRRRYLLYPGKICLDDPPDRCRDCITGKIRAIGRDVSTGYGFRTGSGRKG